MDELEVKIVEILNEEFKYAVCSTCEFVDNTSGEDYCAKCAGPPLMYWKLDRKKADRVALKIAKACIEESKRENPKTTFGQILDLLDKNRESEEEVRLMDSTETSLIGPVCSPFWKLLEGRTVENIGVDDGALEVWLEGD